MHAVNVLSINQEVRRMSSEQAVRLVEITQRKADELFEELIAELRQAQGSAASETIDEIGATDPTAGAGGQQAPEAWSLDMDPLDGGWEETGHSTNETYGWPDGNLDEYDDFFSYRGTGDYAGMSLALGYLANGDVVGFVLGGGGKRGITYFFRTDDFDQTKEKISMIRGGGPRGRSGFAPHEPLPNAYRGFKTDVLRDRKAGKWNVRGVVAKEDDYKTMLGHTALQAKLRGIA
jgi:hypothetical protein